MLLAITLSLIFCIPSYASIHMKAQIYEINYGGLAEDTLVFLSTGHILRLNQNDLHKKKEFEDAKKRQRSIEVYLSDENTIKNYHFSTTPIQSKNKSLHSYHQEANFVPTVIESLELANSYFRQGTYIEKESQCYNRAHIWSYEWFIKNAINSNKTWLFFTRRYIRKFNFDWWFHVSPSVRVMIDGVEKEKIMDLKYSRGPINLKDWTDIFMKDDANCPLIKTYSDYANYPESGSCYTLRTSMFYYQPIDIENKEVWETSKVGWYQEEIRQAYLEAFDQII